MKIHEQVYIDLYIYISCADLEGGSVGSGPPLEFAKLNSTILLEMKKLVIFHICALPQLYV